jgi:hypothetical protein
VNPRISDKNYIPSYGLTLVAGLPLPEEITANIQALQQEIEAAWPGRFRWYTPAQLHVTVAALLRGRYRPGPPLLRSELPGDLEAFAEVLTASAEDVQPFKLKFLGGSLGKGGGLVVRAYGGEAARDRFGAIHARFAELDPPKAGETLHATLGFQRVFSQTSAEDMAGNETRLRNWLEAFAGSCRIEMLWLVHYSNRTLSQVVGKVKLPLGEKSSLNGEELVKRLGILENMRAA